LSSTWQEVIAAERSRGWASLAGSQATVRVPVRQPLIDRLVAAAPMPRALERMAVRLLDRNRLQVAVVASVFGFRKQFDLQLRVAPQATIADAGPRVEVTIENAALLSAALALIGPAIPLPPGIELTPPRLVIDLGAIARSRGAGDLARAIRSVSFQGTSEALWIEAACELPSSPAATDAPSAEPSSPRPLSAGSERPPFTADEILEWLRGAQAAWTLRIGEPLANAAVQAAVSTMQEARRSAPASEPVPLARLARALHSLRLAFDRGALVLEGEAALDGDAGQSSPEAGEHSPPLA
jgi:hypothetical protein